MSEALRLAAWMNEGAWHSMRLGDVEAAGRELRRLAGVEAELQQAREERTAWRVTAENAEEELAALRASLGEPVGSLLVGVEFGEELGDYDIEMNDASCEAINEREAAIGCEATYTLFAIKDTK
jgi:hypothetical protein